MAFRGRLQQQSRQIAYIWQVYVLRLAQSKQTVSRSLSSSASSSEQETSRAAEEAEPADTKPQDKTKLLVLGGNGFVGTHICKEALQRGIPVLSLSRSGRPSVQESWTNEVTWLQGNLFEPEKWIDSLKETSAVISCVGGFGSNETMRKINGDANISAINAAFETGVKRFVYISAFDFGFLSSILRGYFQGKRAAEKVLQSKFPYGGIILRPGFIHGTRQVGSFKVPLSVVGGPLEAVLRSAKVASQVPVIGPLFIPPVKVTTVAKAAVRAASDNAVPPGILDVWGIFRLGDH